MRPKINGATCEPIKIKWGTQLAKRTPGAGQAGRLYFSIPTWTDPLTDPAPAPACCFIMRNKRGNKQEAQPAKFVLKNNNSNKSRNKGIRNSTRTVGKQKEKKREMETENESPFILIYLLTYLVAGSELRLLGDNTRARALLSSARLCCNKNQLIIYHLNSPPLVIMSLFTHCPERER